LLGRKLAQTGWAVGGLAIVAMSCGRTRDGIADRPIADAGNGGDELQAASGGVGGEGGEGVASAGASAAGQGGADGDQTSLSSEDTVALYAGAYCERAERCEFEPGVEQVPGGCGAALLDAWKDALREAEQQIASGKVVYDPSALSACVEARRTAVCDDPDGGFPEACELAFEGTIAIGDACTSSLECAKSAVCRGCPGHCVAPGDIGATCDGENPCVPEAACLSGVCVARAREGQACNALTSARLCAGALPCAGDTLLQDGNCSPFSYAARGERCNPDEGALCEADSVCVNTELVGDALQATCQEREHAPAECWSGYQDSCPVGQYCPLTTAENRQGVLSASCLPLGTAGERCYSPRGCVPNAICSLDICVEQKDLGSQCSQPDECWSGACDQGICAPYDACLNAAVPPFLLRDSARLAAHCPTRAPGALAAGFDDQDTLTDWEIVGGMRSWDEDGASCAGSLHLQAQLSAANSFASTYRARSSWRGRERLHLWAKLAAPGVGVQSNLVGVLAWVRTDGGGYYSRSVDASGMRDGQWHELVVSMDRSALTQAGHWGVDLWTPDAAAFQTPLDLDLLIDDVWVE